MPRTSSWSSVLTLGLALGACTLTVAPGALAQTAASETARVTELFKTGKVAFAKGDMPGAERSFSEALALRKSSDIAANLAQSELEQQKYRKAAEHFAWALANLLPSATDAQRRAVEAGLARSRAEIASLRLEIEPEGADVLVGQDSVGKAPVAGNVFVDPGEVIVSVKHDGFVSIEKRVLVAKGTEQAVEITLAAKESGPPAAPATPATSEVGVDSGLRAPPAVDLSAGDRGATSKSLVPAYVATGVAVAGGVVGLVFTLKANSSSREARSLRDELVALGGCDGGGASELDCADLKSKLEDKDAATNVAVGAFVVGGVAALAAGYFYWDALSHRRVAASGQPRRTILGGLRPSLEVGRTRVTDAASIGPIASVKLTVSAIF